MKQPAKPPVSSKTTPAYSRNRTAEVLGWSPRTLVRRTEDGIICRRPDGRFDREEVDRVLALALSDDEDLDSAEQSSVTSQSLRMFQQAQGHTERMMRLLEQPVHSGLEFLQNIVKSLLERDKERDKAHLEFVQAAGELFLHKAERDAMLIEATGKADALRKIGSKLADHAPTLLAQLTGTKAKDFGAVKTFVDLLDEEDKAGLLAMRGFLDGDEKKAAYMNLLTTIGVSVPEIPEDVQKSA